MWGQPQRTVVDWPRAIKTIWADRLVPVAERDGGDAALAPAWRLALAAAEQHGWTVKVLVPLKADPHGHQWAVVLERDQRFTPHLLLVHGVTPASALRRGATALEHGVELTAQSG